MSDLPCITPCHFLGSYIATAQIIIIKELLKKCNQGCLPAVDSWSTAPELCLSCIQISSSINSTAGYYSWSLKECPWLKISQH